MWHCLGAPLHLELVANCSCCNPPSLFWGLTSKSAVSYCFLQMGTVFWAGLTLTLAQNRSSLHRWKVRAIHAIACWTLTTKSCELAAVMWEEMVGCFNITASLDHLDYNCVVVAGSVYVLGQCVKWSFRYEIKAYFHFRSVHGMSPFRSLFRILQ